MKAPSLPAVAVRRAIGITALVLSALVTVAAQSGPRPGYDIDYIGPPLPDLVIQQAKETYVLYGCAYCHGVNLVPRGEATDLRQSALVGRDVDANVIGPLLRAGIPQTAKLSPMPQFSDLSDQQIRAIARWIHYARAEARYADLTASPGPAGDVQQGRASFARSCAGCHGAARELARLAGEATPSALRVRLLKPPRLNEARSYRLDHLADAATASARQQHQALLENVTAAYLGNLVAYLASVR